MELSNSEKARTIVNMVREFMAREVDPLEPLFRSEPVVELGTRRAAEQWIAEPRAEINASRLMVLQAAWMVEQAGASAARDKTSIAFWYTHERAAQICDGPDEVRKTLVARRVLRDRGMRIASPAENSRT